MQSLAPIQVQDPIFECVSEANALCVDEQSITMNEAETSNAAIV
jgi:hypothetical protein